MRIAFYSNKTNLASWIFTTPYFKYFFLIHIGQLLASGQHGYFLYRYLFLSDKDQESNRRGPAGEDPAPPSQLALPHSPHTGGGKHTLVFTHLPTSYIWIMTKTSNVLCSVVDPDPHGSSKNMKEQINKNVIFL